MRFIIWTGLCVVSALAVSAGADTHYVARAGQTPSGAYINWTSAASNIQDAVSAAAPGDTVLVSNGLYNAGGTADGRVSIPHHTFALLAVSVTPSDTIIDGGGANRVIYVDATNVLIAGFMITNGVLEGRGAGVYNNKNDSAHPLVISNCVIADCRNHDSWREGGGIYGSSRASTILNNCVIEGNSAGSYGGGAANCTLTNNCRVLNNSTTNTIGTKGNYGGLFQCTMYGGSLVSNQTFQHGGGAGLSALHGVEVSYNTAGSAGGGVGYNNDTQGGVYGCSFHHNKAGTIGGAIRGNGNLASNCWFYCNTGTYGGAVAGVILIDCTVSNNTATTMGGGVSKHTDYVTKPAITRSIIIGNTAPQGGGAYECSLTNCLIVNNTATTSGSGARSCDMVNCTIVSNAGSVVGVAGVFGGALTNCVVWDNYDAGSASTNHGGAAIFKNSCTHPLPVGAADGGGNISATPCFLNKDTGDYRLSLDSPCINAGLNLPWISEPGAVDLYLRLRIDRMHGIVDMGCCEYLNHGTIIRIW